MSEDLPKPAASEAPGASADGQSRPSPGSTALGGTGAMSLEMVKDLQVPVSIELGRTRITLDQALNIGEQSLIELNKKVGDSVDILLNGKLFARGEIVTVGENFGVRLTEVLEEV